MKRRVDCEQMRELAAAFALGAVSAAERLAFKAHAEKCRQCARELESYDRVVGSLALAAEPESPRRWVRERLLNYLESGDRPWASDSSLPRTGLRWIPWAVAAGLAIFSLVGLSGWRAATRNATSLSEELAAVRSEAFTLQVSLKGEIAKARDRELATRALNDPGATIVNLVGQGPIRGVAGRIHWDRQHSIWAITTSLPSPQEGTAYQLWFITADQKKISAGLIKSEATDCVFTVVRVPVEIEGLVAAAITLEPAGGSEQPTMPIYAAGSLL